MTGDQFMAASSGTRAPRVTTHSLVIMFFASCTLLVSWQLARFALCHTRRWTICRSVLTTCACGSAVLSTHWGGITYGVQNKRTGRLVKCGDAESLAESALEVVGNARPFAELTRNGLAECANYTRDLVMQGWIATYSESAPKGTSLYPRQT